MPGVPRSLECAPCERQPSLARLDSAGTLHECSVPLSGADAFLFASLALVLAGVFFGNLSEVWLLVAGKQEQPLVTANKMQHTGCMGS